MIGNRRAWWHGVGDIAVIIIAGACVLVGVQGLIDGVAALTGTMPFTWKVPAEITVGLAVPWFLLPRDYRLRTAALTSGLAGIGGLVLTGMAISHPLETGRPLPHTFWQYVLLFAFYGLFVFTFFAWYFWDKAQQRRRPGTRRRDSGQH